jgi:hypothetical protein
MEVKAFQEARKTELEKFKEKYAFLKTEYSKALSGAINEIDPNTQQILVQRVQEANRQLVEELHGMVASLNKGSKGFNPKDMDELTNDLIKYQQDYADIEKSKDKVTTLKAIKNTTAETLNNATIMFYVSIIVLVLLCFIVGYLVFKTNWVETVGEKIATAVGGRL